MSISLEENNIHRLYIWKADAGFLTKQSVDTIQPNIVADAGEIAGTRQPRIRKAVFGGPPFVTC
jgi:hypothetical protein